MIYVGKAPNGIAVIYANEETSHIDGLEIATFEEIPEGHGTLKTDLKTLWWEDPEPVPDPAPTETERLRADVDFIAAMTGVSL